MYSAILMGIGELLTQLFHLHLVHTTFCNRSYSIIFVLHSLGSFLILQVPERVVI
jgi:hypothetical protein